MIQEAPESVTRQRVSPRTSVLFGVLLWLRHLQSPNGENAECRADGEEREGPWPADGAHDGRHELDGNGGEQESQRCLQCQRGPYGMWWDTFRDEHAELGAVGDDEETPDQRDRGEQPERAAERQANQGAADGADGERDDDQPWAADAIGDGAAPDAPDAADGNDGKPDDRCGSRWSGGEGVRRCGDAGGDEGGDPGPVGIQFGLTGALKSLVEHDLDIRANALNVCDIRANARNMPFDARPPNSMSKTPI